MSALYAITFDSQRNGRRHTGTFELDLDRLTERMIASDILAGQYEDVDRVFRFDPEEHTSSDITEDMANAVAQLSYAEDRHPTWELRNWIEHHIGCQRAAEILPREAA